MHVSIPLSTLVLGILACAPSAHAQPAAPASTFEQLASAVKQGDTLVVTDTQGRDVRGRIITLSSESLAIDVDGKTREWRAGDVQSIRHRQPDSLINGTLIGLGVGAGVGLGLGVGVAATEAYAGESGTSEDGNLVLALGVVAGAAIGLAIDAGKRDEVVVFGAPGTTARVRLLPLVTRQAQGVRVAVVF